MTLLELFQLLRKHLRLVIALPLACALVVGVGSLFLPDEYTAETTMYVLSRSDDSEGSTSVTQQDLSAGQMLTNDVASIIQSDRVKADVAQQLGLADLSAYDLDVASSTTTRVITLSVTGTDAQGAANVANAIVADVSQVASDVMQIQSVNVIDEAEVPTQPSGPRRALFALVALVAGLFVAVVIVVLRDTLDTRVRSGEDVQQIVDVPIVGHFQELGR